MPMPPYEVCCSAPGCGHSAVYKVAARWSDGITHELKTYALACADCLPELYRRSRTRRAACRLAPGETLEPPGIYQLARGHRDRQLVRRVELEQQLDTSADTPPVA